MHQVTVLAENAGNTNAGLTIESPSGPSTVAIDDSLFVARGGDNNAIAISAAGADTLLTAEDVSALAENGNGSIGLQLLGANVQLNGGSYTGSTEFGGSSAYGIHVGVNSTLDATGVSAQAENAGSINYGLFNVGGAVTLRGGNYAAIGGSQSAGILSEGAQSSLWAENVNADCTDGGACYGLYTNNGAITLVGGRYRASGFGTDHGAYHTGGGMLSANGSAFEGEDYGFYNNSATAELVAAVISGNTPVNKTGSAGITVSNSRLVGGPVSGTVTCLLVSRDTDAMVTGACP
jgi:hypothetical protein